MVRRCNHGRRDAVGRFLLGVKEVVANRTRNDRLPMLFHEDIPGLINHEEAVDHDSAVLILVENDGGFLLVVFCISWSDFEREIENRGLIL